MTSRGDTETNRMRKNIEDQLKRLITQLQDIEEMKDELDDEEYSTSRQETIDQMKDFEVSLQKMASGDISLVDDIGSAQLAIQAAIRSVNSPEILNMFLKKENSSLRSKLASLNFDLKLGRISKDSHNSQAAEILNMLVKLGEELSLSEQEILKQDSGAMDGFASTSGEELASTANIMAAASSQIDGAKR